MEKYEIQKLRDLQIVVVHNNNQIVQFPETCPHSCLPDLSLLDLTISAKCVDTVIFFIELACCCHSRCNRKSLSQRTG